MSTAAAVWAEAIGFEAGDDGMPTVGTVARHLRAAIVEAGVVSRMRLTTGLKEAYQPFAIPAEALRSRIEETLDLLVAVGDVDSFSTAGGRTYAATPPRLIDWGSDTAALLGGVASEPGGVVRRVARPDSTELPVAVMSLGDELGRADWRTALVDLGGADAASTGPQALFDHARALAMGGERISEDAANDVVALAGRGDFFGSAERAPKGRWMRLPGPGVFPAAMRATNHWRYVVLSATEDGATIWQPATHDLWRWIVVGATLAADDPVFRYDPSSEVLAFLTPPPSQLTRAARLVGEQQSPWRWGVDAAAVATVRALL